MVTGGADVTGRAARTSVPPAPILPANEPSLRRSRP
jgi:hypothetical protein